jgi:hypothetical protein
VRIRNKFLKTIFLKKSLSFLAGSFNLICESKELANHALT